MEKGQNKKQKLSVDFKTKEGTCEFESIALISKWMDKLEEQHPGIRNKIIEGKKSAMKYWCLTQDLKRENKFFKDEFKKEKTREKYMMRLRQFFV